MSDRNLPLVLKYRPKKFSDLIGQDPIVKILSNSIKDKTLHHAYIFSGKYGSGKTTAARIFAASLNSPGGPSLEPDLSSQVIQDIFEGKSLDVIELDAASNRGIDEIRELKSRISLAPIECKYKIVILDEAHAMTDAACEASLKMIEEPPRNVIFILCTTNANKIKDTIHSRCIHLKFNKIHWMAMSSHLKEIAKKENISYDDEAMVAAAKKSDGSMRNAVQNLQTLVTYAGIDEKISFETAQSALNVLDESYYFDFVDYIMKPDAGEAMRVIDQLLLTGRNVGDVLEGLVAHLRNLLIAGTCKSVSGLLVLTEDEKKKYLAQINNMKEIYQNTQIQFIVSLLEFIAYASRDISLNINPQTVFETFAIKSIIEGAKLKKQIQSAK